MTAALHFTKAARTAIKIKLGVTGPSGAGKTLGALALASGLGSQVAVIDTENGSASTYSDRFAFDVLELAPPFTSKRYEDAIDAAVAAGYDVLVIDSLSHQWAGDGGILSRKEELDKRPGSNSYTNWAIFTKEHTAFVAHILHAPIHVIATLRTKQDYVLETNEKGKQQPRKVGLAPVQREGLEYEFSTVFELQMDHRATTSKDRTGLFGDALVDLCAPSTAAQIRAWLDTAKPAESKPQLVLPGATEAQVEQILALLDEPAIDATMREKVQRALKRGLTEARAAEIIAGLEATFDAGGGGRSPHPHTPDFVADVAAMARGAELDLGPTTKRRGNPMEAGY